ncbi:MAG TPA: hypothetical protein VFZ41_08875 [Solirubrobacterales bacterium]
MAIAIEVESGTVLMLITLAVLPIAAISFALSGKAWRGVGKGRFAIEQEARPRPTADPPPVDRAVQEAEARQMLEAKAYRRARRGEPPIDVEAELRSLLEGPGGANPAGEDPELRSEVRRLVIARNERRMRRGEPPLDVEAETERQLANLVGSS